MSTLQALVKNGLDEARMLVLGAQVLLGFQYRSFFESEFERLPAPARQASLWALVCLLATLLLLFTPAARHRLVERGRDSERFHRFVLGVTGIALLFFALAMGLGLGVAASRILGGRGAVGCGLATTLVALAFWYGHFAHGDRKLHSHREDEVEHTPLDHRIVQVLTEARVVLPGVQALLGFSLAMTLMETFPRLPRPAQLVHLASLGCIALATVFLIAPAAYHRIVERGHDTERFHTYASRMVLLSLFVLAPGFAGDLYVVLRRVGYARAAAPLAGATVLVFWGVWFGLSALIRQRARSRERSAPDLGREPARA